jgi:uncharacterized protein with HEPN domain
MIALRNHLIHGYDRLSLETIWHTAQNCVPRVIAGVDVIPSGLDP